MLGHLRTLLAAMIAKPEQRVDDLPLLTSAEHHQLLVEWNQTDLETPENSCLHELIEAQVERTPDAVAVEFEGRHLTYQELNCRANQIAHRLRELAVGPDVLVGICAEHSLELVVGLLGVFKAGGAYVPIAPTYPPARVAFMLEDAAAPVMLTQQHLVSTLPARRATQIICLDGAEWAASNIDSSNPPRNVTDDNLAYMIYTSGSTGKPKGAMISHRALVNHMQWLQSVFPLDETDCVLQKTPISFDASVWEFYAPLLVGGRLAVARPEGHRDMTYLIEAIARQRVSVLQLVPSLLGMLLETPGFANCHSLRRVFCGGEVLTSDLVRRFFQTLKAELVNLYGPTEVTIDSLFYPIPRSPRRCRTDRSAGGQHTSLRAGPSCTTGARRGPGRVVSGGRTTWTWVPPAA